MSNHAYVNLLPHIKGLLIADGDVSSEFGDRIEEELEPSEYFTAHTIKPFINIYTEVRPVDVVYNQRTDGETIVNIDVVYSFDVTNRLNRYIGARMVENVLRTNANRKIVFESDKATAIYQGLTEFPAIDLSKQLKLIQIAFVYKYLDNK